MRRTVVGDQTAFSFSFLLSCLELRDSAVAEVDVLKVRAVG
jgi:hypothetical protein